MPRGGKRPGAGAPNGDFYAIRPGDDSSPMLAACRALIGHPHKPPKKKSHENNHQSNRGAPASWVGAAGYAAYLQSAAS